MLFGFAWVYAVDLELGPTLNVIQVMDPSLAFCINVIPVFGY